MKHTLYDKIWNDHLVKPAEGEMAVIYVDRHLVHEVTSPQAFEALRLAGRKVRCPHKTFATMDHNVPTVSKDFALANEVSRHQMETLKANCEEFSVRCFDFTDPDQGVIHIIAPELGLTQPGMVIVCGDSHTATHGAFGALSFGIGTSEVEHVLATQTLQQNKSPVMRITVTGKAGKGVSAKDVILHIIGTIGTAGATGFAIEYAGAAIRELSMEGRMTICNMSIEAGARSGMIAPDQVTIDYLKGRPFAPQGRDWEKAVAYWKTLTSDPDAVFDKEITIRAEDISPQVTWGTSPGQGTSVNGTVPAPEDFKDPVLRSGCEKALRYMGLTPGTPMDSIPIDVVFVGSCTNGRLEDFRAAARILQGRKVHSRVTALAVPGSEAVKRAAEQEGLDKIFKDAGFEWRYSGCSMCLAMNDDQVPSGKRCASTSNRNFEGRQGPGSRTHLMSPEMAAAAAVEGKITDVKKYL